MESNYPIIDIFCMLQNKQYFKNNICLFVIVIWRTVDFD